MNRFCKILITLILCSFPFANISAEENLDSIHLGYGITNDTLFHIQDSTIKVPDSLVFEPSNIQTNSSEFSWLINNLPSWLQGYANNLLNGHVDRTFEKKVDLSWGVIPSYGHEANFGLLAAVSGQYRVNRKDSTLSPSDFTASFNASLNGFFVLNIYGNHIFSDHKSRLLYNIETYRKRLDFWGLTAEECNINPKSRYDRRQIDAQVNYIYNLNRNFYTGLSVRANYTDATNIWNQEYLLGDRTQYYVNGLGVSLEFDTRDHLVTPTKGLHIVYRPMIYPQFMGDAGATFHSHNFIFDGYLKMWKGSVLAFDWYTKINSSHTPWTMREMIAADGVRMRGYYMGSTIDNNQIAAQIEYRQHIWSRFGLVLWGGGATIFSDISKLIKHETKPQWFPNYGVGLRFEFKNNVNIRADYGFGKNTSGLIVTIGEAF